MQPAVGPEVRGKPAHGRSAWALRLVAVWLLPEDAEGEGEGGGEVEFVGEVAPHSRRVGSVGQSVGQGVGGGGRGGRDMEAERTLEATIRIYNVTPGGGYGDALLLQAPIDTHCAA